MRLHRVAALLLFCLPLAAQSVPSPLPALQADLKQAAKFFQRGEQERNQGKFRQAIASYQQAVKLAPGDVRYPVSLAMAQQQLIAQLTQKGTAQRIAGKKIEAMASYREALEIDPENAFVRQQIEQLLPNTLSAGSIGKPQVELAPATELRPSGANHPIHYRGDSKQLLRAVSQMYGLTAFVDDSVRSRPVNVDLDSANWSQASTLMALLTNSFAVPLAANQVLYVMDDTAHRTSMQTLQMCTFHLTQAATSQEMNDFANIMRLLFNIHFIAVDTATYSISVRAPGETVAALTAFLRQFEESRPEVMLDMEVFQYASTGTNKIGPTTPSSFHAFNLPSELRSLLGDSAAASIINELETTGTLSSTSLATIIAALESSSSSSLLTSAFYVFGGGEATSAVTIPSLSLQLLRSTSRARSLQKILLRASQNKPASLKLGSRFPVASSTYTATSGSTTVNLSTLTGGAAYTPTISYEDLGLSLKATPVIHSGGVVQFTLEVQLRAISSYDSNGMPVISNREYTGTVTASDSEPIILTSYLTRNESGALDGNQFTGPVNSHDNEFTTSQMTIVLRPHIIAGAVATPAMALPLAAHYDR
jgi:tetratricopeptide (TPR) repeat protein